MYLKQVKARFRSLERIRHQDVKPCTEEEVHELEKALGFSVPAAYKEFLLWMGYGARTFMRGSDWSYWFILRIQQGAVELLEENGNPEVLPEDALVFFMHQGYFFYFMRVSEGENPPIYFYTEVMDHPRFTLAHQNLAEFLLSRLDQSLQYFARYGKNAL